MDPEARGALMDAIKAVLYWILTVASVALTLYYRKNRSSGWTLYKLIFATIVCQTTYWTMWGIHNAAVRSVGYGSLTDSLYRICIPLWQLAMASFMGVLLVLASGYCITRSDFGEYKVQVLGLPILLFVTGTVTQYINFQFLEASTDQLDVLDMAGWEQGLFAVCTFLNVAAFMFWVVYIFEIIQQEVDALRAQQELNLVRNAAPSATVAPFPSEPGVAGSAPHANMPNNIDPNWAQAAAEEGVVAYKNLLGPNQNMSHIPGADVEAQEITTVADMLNFETKNTMYRRFSTGFGVFMIAQLCVILAPVFIIEVVQEVITMFQFLVVLGFLAALLWLFRPVQDSPYLLMGDDLSHLDTSLGVEEDEDQGIERAMHGLQQNGYGPSTTTATASSSSGVEMSAQLPGRLKRPGSGDRISNGGRTVTWAPTADRDQRGRDQSGAGDGTKSSTVSTSSSTTGPGLPSSGSAQDLNPHVRLPAIRTSVGGPQQQQQQGGAVAAAQFSLGEDDDLHEIKLHNHSLSPQKQD